MKDDIQKLPEETNSEFCNRRAGTGSGPTQKEGDMSTNCMRCVVNERAGVGLLCAQCREDFLVDAEVKAMDADPTHGFGEEYYDKCVRLLKARQEVIGLRATMAGLLQALAKVKCEAGQLEALGLQHAFDAAKAAMQRQDEADQRKGRR